AETKKNFKMSKNLISIYQLTNKVIFSKAKLNLIFKLWIKKYVSTTSIITRIHHLSTSSLFRYLDHARTKARSKLSCGSTFNNICKLNFRMKAIKSGSNWRKLS